MAKTESMMVELGTEAPAFELTDVVSGRAVSARRCGRTGAGCW